MLTAEERERLHRAQGRDLNGKERARMNRELNAAKEKESQDELFNRQFWRDVYLASVQRGEGPARCADNADAAFKDLKIRSFK